MRCCQAGFFLFVLLVSPFAWAEEGLGTKEEAEAMSLRAAVYIQQVGVEKALASFQNDPQWIDRDLYVAVIDNFGISHGNSYTASMNGKNLYDLKDVDGKYLVRELLKVQETGWVDYKWINPVTKRIAHKHAYVIRVGDYRVFVGYYD